MKVRYLLDTNVLSDLIPHPQGPVAERIANVGEFSRVPGLMVENWLAQ